MTLRPLSLTGPVNGLQDYETPFKVHINISDRRMLMLDQHLIAFESRKLNEEKQSYPTYEKKIITVVHYLQTWRHYLWG